jgi:hypothetical protein
MICLLSGFRHFRKQVPLCATSELTKFRGGLHNITAFYSEYLAFESRSRDHLLSLKASICPSIHQRMSWDALSGYQCGVILHPV